MISCFFAELVGYLTKVRRSSKEGTPEEWRKKEKDGDILE
jgi:hypothetical protein